MLQCPKGPAATGVFCVLRGSTLAGGAWRLFSSHQDVNMQADNVGQQGPAWLEAMLGGFAVLY